MPFVLSDSFFTFNVMKANAAILIFSFLLQFAFTPAFSSVTKTDGVSLSAQENFGICIPDLPVEDSEGISHKISLSHLLVSSDLITHVVYKPLLTALPPLVLTIETPRHIQLRVLRN